MKKQLLSTSALVAAGLVASAGAVQAQTAPAASPITVTVGGFMSQFVSYDKMSNNTNTSALTVSAKTNEWSQSSDTEIYFSGKTTLANGIGISMRVELEGNTTTDTIDESWMTIEGGFGRVDLGSTDQAVQKMQYAAPAAYITSNGVAGSYPNINPTTGSFGTTVPGKSVSNTVSLNDDDGSKISYYTPKFEGFQAGVSYVPQNAQDRNATGLKTADGYYNGWFGAVNFVRTFGEIDVAAFVGAGKWSKPQNNATFDASTIKDPRLFAFGGQVGFAGFKVGAGYARAKDNFTLATGTTVVPTTKGDGNVWEVGATYAFGPATVGVTYYQGTDAGLTSNSAGNHSESIHLDGDYKIGTGVRTGVRLSNGFIHGEKSSVGGRDPDNFKFSSVQWDIKLDF